MSQNILTKAVLVNLSIGQFNPKRQDAKITSEVLNKHGVMGKAGNWMKNLIDPDSLDDIQKVAQYARMEHYRLSLPWADDGWRILPVAMYQQYQDTMRQARKDYQAEVEKFMAKYPSLIEEARRVLNGMFNAADYPSADTVQSKFYMSVNMSPVPSGNDFRVSLAGPDMVTMQADVDERVKAATQAAAKDLWQRLITPVKNMAEKLGTKDAIFRDTLVSNLEEIIGLIPSLNITGDATLETFARECKEKLAGVNPEDLRKNKDARAEVATQAADILKRLEGYNVA